MKRRADTSLKSKIEVTRAAFWQYIKPGVLITVWADAGARLIPAVVVRVNLKSVTIRLGSGETKRVSRNAIADLAPGERDRQASRS